MGYFFYHFLFFAAFSLQNYLWYEQSDFYFSFLILVFFYLSYVVRHFKDMADKRKMRVMGQWLKPRLKLKIMEHSLLAVTMLMIPFYMQEEQLFDIQGWMVMIPLTLSVFIGIMVVKYDQTPCNATL